MSLRSLLQRVDDTFAFAGGRQAPTEWSPADGPLQPAALSPADVRAAKAAVAFALVASLAAVCVAPEHEFNEPSFMIGWISVIAAGVTYNGSRKGTDYSPTNPLQVRVVTADVPVVSRRSPWTDLLAAAVATLCVLAIGAVSVVVGASLFGVAVLVGKQKFYRRIEWRHGGTLLRRRGTRWSWRDSGLFFREDPSRPQADLDWSTLRARA